MSANLKQIFDANPITSNASTDLIYFMQSPYGAGTDASMTFLDFAAQFGSANWIVVSANSQSISPNKKYITDNGASLVTYTLPVSMQVGDEVKIAGKSSGLFKIAQNASQIIHFGEQSSTTGVAGSIDSINNFDFIKLLCVTANTEFTVVGATGNFTII